MRSRGFVVISLVALALCSPGCVTRGSRPAKAMEVRETPPQGRVLVNFHRPAAGRGMFSVFERTALIGIVYGRQRFQFLCDPGEYVFIGRPSKGRSVSVVHANVEADRVYDCVVSGGVLFPFKKDDVRREDIPEWEFEVETPVVINEDFKWQDVQAKYFDLNLEAVQTGLGRAELQTLAPDDHRDD